MIAVGYIYMPADWTHFIYLTKDHIHIFLFGRTLDGNSLTNWRMPIEECNSFNFNIFRTLSLQNIFNHILKLKNVDRRIQLIPSTFSEHLPKYPQIVYDSHTLAYLCGRPLPCQQHQWNRKSPIFFHSASTINLYLLSEFFVHMNSNVQVSPESKGSFQIRFTQTSGMPILPVFPT